MVTRRTITHRMVTRQRRREVPWLLNRLRICEQVDVGALEGQLLYGRPCFFSVLNQFLLPEQMEFKSLRSRTDRQTHTHFRVLLELGITLFKQLVVHLRKNLESIVNEAQYSSAKKTRKQEHERTKGRKQRRERRSRQRQPWDRRKGERWQKKEK